MAMIMIMMILMKIVGMTTTIMMTMMMMTTMMMRMIDAKAGRGRGKDTQSRFDKPTPQCRSHPSHHGDDDAM